MSTRTHDVETGHEWQVDGDTQIAFTLGWSYDKGEPETRGSWSGDDPGVPEHMELESVKIDPDACTPGFEGRKQWVARFMAEIDLNDKLREQLEAEAMEAYFARRY